MGKGAGGCHNRPAMVLAAETDDDVRERAISAALGSAVGDALGGTVEFMTQEKIFQQFNGPHRHMIGGGVWSLRPGQITDDTEMALGLMRSIQLCGGYHPSAALHQYLEWFKGDPVDVGQTCAYVLQKAQFGYPADWAAQEFHELSGGMSAGNGAIMRQTPLAIHYRHDLDALEAAVIADTKLTHFDPLAAECSVYFSRQLAQTILNPDHEWEQSDNPMIQAAVDADADDVYRRVDEQMGFCLTALAVAAYTSKHADSYESGMLWTVNQGGDADTNAAVAGAILGAKFTGIPEVWEETMEETEQLENLVDWSMSGNEGEGNDPWFAQPKRPQADTIMLPLGEIDPWNMSLEDIETLFEVAPGTFTVLDEDDEKSLRQYLADNLA